MRAVTPVARTWHTSATRCGAASWIITQAGEENRRRASQTAKLERHLVMDSTTGTFERLRPRLQAIAYRMLGSLAEAEEVVQDVWLRWHEAARDALDNPDGWLVTVTTRLAIDRFRSAKIQRQHYVGQWLPEPHLTDSPSSPEQILERADELSLAFLMVLERLSPEARAAF